MVASGGPESRPSEEPAEHEAKAEREAADERRVAAGLPDPRKAIERAKALHSRARTAVEAFATTEEELASIHERLAARLPEHREECLRTARKAREAARKAREISRVLTD